MEAARRGPAMALERILLGVVALSVTLMGTGVVLTVVGGEALPQGLSGAHQLVPGLVQGEPAAYLSLGLLILVATPVLRVAGSLVVFLLERDWRFVLVTAGILGIIALSVLLGRV